MDTDYLSVCQTMFASTALNVAIPNEVVFNNIILSITVHDRKKASITFLTRHDLTVCETVGASGQ